MYKFVVIALFFAVASAGFLGSYDLHGGYGLAAPAFGYAAPALHVATPVVKAVAPAATSYSNIIRVQSASVPVVKSVVSPIIKPAISFAPPAVAVKTVAAAPAFGLDYGLGHGLYNYGLGHGLDYGGLGHGLYNYGLGHGLDYGGLYHH